MTIKIAVAGALALVVAGCDDARRGEERPAAERAASIPPRESSTVASHRPASTPCDIPFWVGVDTTPARRVSRHSVNRGAPGMFAQVRWSLSPDGCTMLVVHDPAAVEADPVPNGFLLVSEGGPALFQRDSAWDVSPSADWERIAFTRAFDAQPKGAADSLSRTEWRDLATRVGLAPELVRQSAFACSGMNYVYCVARLYVADVAGQLDRVSASGNAVRALPVLAGWRVRWRAEGSALLAGIAPQGSQDHAPPTRWVVVDPESGTVRDTLGAADTLDLVPIAWHDGPMLTYGVALDLASRSELPIDGAMIVSEGGWVSVQWRGPGGMGQSFRVGSGRALAATRSGRFIAAIVPGRAIPEQEWAYDIVVYQLYRGVPAVELSPGR